MKRFIMLYALAIVASLTLYANNTVQAATDANPSNQDNSAQPEVRRTSWGAVKAIYRGNQPLPYSAERAESTAANRAIKPGATPAWRSYTGDWSNNIISEAFYTLNIYHTGSSNCVYRGMAMSDWPRQVGYTYPRGDPDALRVVSAYIGGPNVGNIDGTYNGCAGRGGYCKFFVDLVLYRSSYGIGGGWHLVLPPGTYDYSAFMTPYGVSQAQRGWVIQRGGPYPHTAIVAANLGWGLDLIDSNNVDKDGLYVIARHAFSWGELGGYTAYRPTYMRQVVNGVLQP